MPVYEYKGIDAVGKKVSGMMDAENEKVLRAKLRKTGVFTTEMFLSGSRATTLKSDVKSIRFFKRVKVGELAHATRQLATLISANVPLVEALSALTEQIENDLLKKAISQVKEKVTQGARLADSLKEFPNIFSELYIHMVRAGEISGALDQVLTRLADFTEYQAKLVGKVRGALTYPLVMAIVGLLLMTYLMVSVVPGILSVFISSKQKLPLPTEIVWGISRFMQSYWWLVLIVVVVTTFLVRRYFKKPAGRLKLDRFALKMPLFGPLFRKLAVSRFSRTLATLLRSGVQLLPALEIVKYVVSNVVLADVIDKARTQVKEGESLAAPLRQSRQFPPLVTQMIAIGEKTGNVEVMLEKIADGYELEVDTTVNSLTTLLEPLMIVVMGGMVGLVVFAIMLPILQMEM